MENEYFRPPPRPKLVQRLVALAIRRYGLSEPRARVIVSEILQDEDFAEYEDVARNVESFDRLVALLHRRCGESADRALPAGQRLGNALDRLARRQDGPLLLAELFAARPQARWALEVLRRMESRPIEVPEPTNEGLCPDRVAEFERSFARRLKAR